MAEEKPAPALNNNNNNNTRKRWWKKETLSIPSPSAVTHSHGCKHWQRVQSSHHDSEPLSLLQPQYRLGENQVDAMFQASSTLRTLQILHGSIGFLITIICLQRMHLLFKVSVMDTLCTQVGVYHATILMDSNLPPETIQGHPSGVSSRWML